MTKHVIGLAFCMLFISNITYATVDLTSSNGGDLLKISVDEGSRVKIAPNVYKYKAVTSYPYNAPVRVLVNCKSKLWKVDSVIKQTVDDYGNKGKLVEKKINWGWEFITIKSGHGGELCE
jgi:hypothetical protein